MGLGQMSKLAIKYVSPDDLRPYAGNARTHSKKQIRQIADSIQRFGFANPVLVSEDGEVVAGHGRLAAAKLLSLASVPVVVLADMTVADRRAYLIADNKLAELAGWDRDILAIELQFLQDVQFDDIEVTGFSLGEIDMILDEDQKADVVLTDPPFNVPIDGHVSGLGKVKHQEFAMVSGEMSGGGFPDFLSSFL